MPILFILEKLKWSQELVFIPFGMHLGIYLPTSKNISCVLSAKCWAGVEVLCIHIDFQIINN
jgi:hypothetical protein